MRDISAIPLRMVKLCSLLFRTHTTENMPQWIEGRETRRMVEQLSHQSQMAVSIVREFEFVKFTEISSTTSAQQLSGMVGNSG